MFVRRSDVVSSDPSRCRRPTRLATAGVGDFMVARGPAGALKSLPDGERPRAGGHGATGDGCGGAAARDRRLLPDGGVGGEHLWPPRRDRKSAVWGKSE